MKVAISAVSEDLNQQVTTVFGRCPGFIIVEIEETEITGHSFTPNQAATAAMGAGIAAAQTVVEQGIQAVISGNIGPNALMVLQQSGIKFYQAVGITVKQAAEQLAKGKLKEMTAPSAPGHFGIGPGMGLGRGAGMGRGRGMGRGAGRGKGQQI